MTLPVLLAREVLRQRYRASLGGDFADFAETLEPGDGGVAWRWVDPDLRPTDEPDGGLILDNEIGVCLYLLPFTPTTQIAEQLEQAAGVQGWLEPARDTGYRRADPLGAWRVVVHWMVELDDLDAWVRDVSRLRAGTEHLEKVAVDAVVNIANDWTRACTDHGFPRLLFTTRRILRMKAPAEVTAWASADERVRSAVRSLPDACRDETERRLAGEVAAHLESLGAPAPPEPPAAPDAARPLTAIRIRRFRNLDDVTFTFAESGATDAAVIHGPNGTGKSNVFEALSIALSGASERFRRFAMDRNVPATARAKRYVNDYLRPVHDPDPDAVPTVALNDGAESPLALREGEAMHEALATLSGALLSQEESGAFLEMSAADLGARIVGDASRLADAVLEHTRSRHEAARREQQAFLREWNLSPAIRKESTARERMARRKLESTLTVPDTLLKWLETEAFEAISALSEARTLATRWRSWQENHELVAIRLVEHTDESSRVDAIAGTLDSGGEIRADTRRWLETVRERVAAWPENLVEQINRFGEWLARPAPASTQAPPPAALTEERTRLEAEQQKVLERGRRLRARLDHLDRAAPLLGGGADATECPTCGTDLRARGGAAAAVQAVRARLDSEIEACRARYREVTARLKATEAKLASAGALPSPLDANQQAVVLESIAWLMPEGADGRAHLRDAERRGALTGVIERLARTPELPDWPEGERVEATARETAAALGRAFDRIVAVSANEAAWRAVQKRLNERLSALVGEHLPATLEALWVELAWNLTPAPWQYRARPGFNVSTARQQSVATVAMTALGRPRLARFLLNEAEVRVLGLSWFFVRHLTGGRFRHAFAVLDDPAAQMDEPTFRDLGRLLGALCRVHGVQQAPWMLVLFLNDHRRADTVARATGATLHGLQWNRGTNVVLESRRVMGPDWTAPWAGDVVEIR
jgi:hypothetical protein